MTGLDLTGKAAVVTGGGSGIGRSVAEHYAHAGASVLLVDLDEATAADAAKDVAAQGGVALGFRADVTVRGSAGTITEPVPVATSGRSGRS